MPVCLQGLVWCLVRPTNVPCLLREFYFESGSCLYREIPRETVGDKPDRVYYRFVGFRHWYSLWKV